MSTKPSHQAAAPQAQRPASAELGGLSRRVDNDPFASVLTLGNDAMRVGAIVGIFLAVVGHGAASINAFTSLFEMSQWVASARESVRDFYWTTYDIEPEREKPKEEEPDPEPEPEPEIIEPEPEVVEPVEPVEPEPNEIYEEEPPAPVEAAPVLVADSDPNEPLDFTDTIVTGSGDGDFYGFASGEGTAKKATKNKNVKVGGKPGGTGTGDPGPRPPKAAAVNKSKPPGLLGGTSWNCPFPPQADTEQIDRAAAVIVVTVRPDGTPLSVKVVNDPGYGFGRAARTCALGRTYAAGLDKDGRPTTATSPPITVNFTR